MFARSRLARSAATLALAVGVLTMVTASPTYAATKDQKAPKETESNQEITDKILNGIHFAADAADFVVPLVVDTLHPQD
jgi:hypothetical protein